MLTRRTLLTALASLPLCGWIKPKPYTLPVQKTEPLRWYIVPLDSTSPMDNQTFCAMKLTAKQAMEMRALEWEC